MNQQVLSEPLPPANPPEAAQEALPLASEPAEVPHADPHQEQREVVFFHSHFDSCASSRRSGKEVGFSVASPPIARKEGTLLRYGPPSNGDAGDL